MTIEEAIKTAVEYEVRIRDIYREATAAVNDEIGKRIFETLGKDEQYHIDYLHYKLKQWQDTGAIVSERLDSAIPSAEVVNREAEKIKTLVAKDFLGIRRQMLSKALKMEIETSDFYQKMVNELPAEGRALFERFLEIENNHIKAVQFELDYLSKNGYWFDIKEFDMEWRSRKIPIYVDMKCIYASGRQETEIYTYLSRRSLMKLISLSAFGVGLWISACDHSNADSAPTAEIKKGSKMESTKSNATIKTRIPAIDAAAPTETRTATFALGWFWGPDSRFGSLDGVVRTRVGYSGGQKENPTYRSIGDHSETLQIDFDPTRISYQKLLDIFWHEHDPTHRAWSPQYKSVIFYHDETQQKLALETKAIEKSRRNKKIQTEILPFDKFYLAEDYHQKYQLRQRRQLMTEFKVTYPREIYFVNLTAAARVNGHVGGHGEPEEIAANIESLGLSAAAQKRLLEISNKGKN